MTKTCSRELRLRRRFTFQHDYDLKHTAKPTQEWLWDKSECPWVAQPETGLEPDRTSLERPENSCGATLPFQPDRSWEDLQRRMGETPQIQVCQACSVIPKKTWGCNRCQRCFNKVLSKRVWKLRKCDISIFSIFNTFQKICFCFVIMGIVCRLLRGKRFNPF